MYYISGSGSGIDYRQCALQIALQWSMGRDKTPSEVAAAAQEFLAFLTRDDSAKEADPIDHPSHIRRVMVDGQEMKGVEGMDGINETSPLSDAINQMQNQRLNWPK